MHLITQTLTTRRYAPIIYLARSLTLHHIPTTVPPALPDRLQLGQVSQEAGLLLYGWNCGREIELEEWFACWRASQFARCMAAAGRHHMCPLAFPAAQTS